MCSLWCGTVLNRVDVKYKIPDKAVLTQEPSTVETKLLRIIVITAVGWRNSCQNKPKMRFSANCHTWSLVSLCSTNSSEPISPSFLIINPIDFWSGFRVRPASSGFSCLPCVKAERNQLNIQIGLVNLLVAFNHYLNTPPSYWCQKPPHCRQNLMGLRKDVCSNKIKLTWEKKIVVRCKEWWAAPLFILFPGLFKIITQSVNGRAKRGEVNSSNLQMQHFGLKSSHWRA